MENIQKKAIKVRAMDVLMAKVSAKFPVIGSVAQYIKEKVKARNEQFLFSALANQENY